MRVVLVLRAAGAMGGAGSPALSMRPEMAADPDRAGSANFRGGRVDPAKPLAVEALRDRTMKPSVQSRATGGVVTLAPGSQSSSQPMEGKPAQCAAIVSGA